MIGAFFHRLFIRFLKSLQGTYLLWHLVAIGATVVLVLSGFDWWFYLHTRFESLYLLVLVAGLGGFFVPVIVPIGMYIVGDVLKKPYLRLTAAAMAQAALFAYLISIFYKVFSGRTPPRFITDVSTNDITHQFLFGIYKGGIFDGWPSSHAAVAVASAFVLAALIPYKDVRVYAFVWAAVVMCGAAVGFHWFSDVVAGAIIGTTVGLAVSRDAKRSLI